MIPELRNGFRLDGFEVFPLQNEIVGVQGSRRIQPKAMDVLCCLTAHAGNVVERETLLEEVWNRTIVTDEVLTRCISELRNVFGDSASQPAFIQTVPKRGYRLVVRPEKMAAETPGTSGMAPDQNARSFWEDIRHRNVVRVGIAYVIVAWVAIQVADTTFPYLRLPEWLTSFIVVASVIGFPIALILAWVYEITPEGIIVDKPGRPGSPSSRGLRRLDLLTIVAVIAGVSIAAYQYVKEPDQGAQLVATGVSAVPSNAADTSQRISIAVLPFDYVSDSHERAYISDSFAEDMIQLLADIPQLRVSPRIASFLYKDEAVSDQTIAERLQVDAFLTGNIGISDNTIIVTARLMDSRRKSEIWSDRIVKPLQDIFDLQDQIAQNVIGELGIEQRTDNSAAQSSGPPTAILGAYEFFAQARDYMRRPRDENNISSAERLLNRALELDPKYAEAYALLCEVHLARYARLRDEESFEIAEKNCFRSNTFDASNANLAVAIGSLYRHSGQFKKAIDELRAAIERDPRQVQAYTELAIALHGDHQEAEAERTLRDAIKLEPRYFGFYSELGNLLYRQQRYTEAAEYYMVWTELTPNAKSAFNNLASAHYMMDDFGPASEAWEQSLEIGKTRSTYTNLGMSYYYLGNFSDAAEMQRQASILAPKDHRVWGRLAESARFLEGHEAESNMAYGEAINQAHGELRINSEDWRTVGLLALYQSHVGDSGQARATLKRGSEMAPGEPDLHYFAALTYLQLGDRDSVYAELRTAIDLRFSRRLVRADPDLAPLLEEERFQALLIE